MADDVANPPPDSDAGGPSPISRKVGPLPVWGWFVIAAGVLGVFLIWRSRQGSAASGTPFATGSTGAGVTQVDPLTGENLLTAIQNLTSALQQSSPSGPNATGSGFFATVRDSGLVPQWDSMHPGVPIWSALGSGSILEFAPFGSQLQILDVRQGPSNMGVTTWYKVMIGGIVGWISAFDLAAFTGTPPPNFGLPGLGPPNPLPYSPGPGGIRSAGVPSARGGIAAVTAPPAIFGHTAGAGLMLARTNVPHMN